MDNFELGRALVDYMDFIKSYKPNEHSNYLANINNLSNPTKGLVYKDFETAYITVNYIYNDTHPYLRTIVLFYNDGVLDTSVGAFTNELATLQLIPSFIPAFKHCPHVGVNALLYNPKFTKDAVRIDLQCKIYATFFYFFSEPIALISNTLIDMVKQVAMAPLNVYLVAAFEGVGFKTIKASYDVSPSLLDPTCDVNDSWFLDFLERDIEQWNDSFESEAEKYYASYDYDYDALKQRLAKRTAASDYDYEFDVYELFDKDNPYKEYNPLIEYDVDKPFDYFENKYLISMGNLYKFYKWGTPVDTGYDWPYRDLRCADPVIDANVYLEDYEQYCERFLENDIEEVYYDFAKELAVFDAIDFENNDYFTPVACYRSTGFQSNHFLSDQSLGLVFLSLNTNLNTMQFHDVYKDNDLSNINNSSLSSSYKRCITAGAKV